MPLNFPTPNLGDSTTLTHTVAGITWTWNSTKNVWSSDISPAADGAEVGSLQTVTDNGAVTTNACEFGGGVKVTGGDDASTLQTYDNGLYVRNDDGGIVIAGPSGSTCQNYIGTVTTAGTNATGIRGSFGFGSNYTTVSQFHAVPGSNYLNSGSADKAVGFTADSSIAHPNATAGYGFLSTLTGNDNYNFYAAGDAPNYFAGLTEHAGGAQFGDYKIEGTTATFSLTEGENLIAYVQKNRDNNIALGGAGAATNVKFFVANKGNEYTIRGAHNLADIQNPGTVSYNGPSAIVGTLSLDSDENFEYVSAFRASSDSTIKNKSNVKHQIGYLAVQQLDQAFNNYGFYSEVNAPGANSGGGDNYGFYAGGSAPNYFKGATRIGGSATGTFNPGYGNTDVGFVGATFADITKGAILYISRNDGFCSSFNTNTVGNLMDFRSGGAQAGYLNVTADTGVLLVSNSATGPVIVQNSDARVKTLTPFTSNAADVVSQLNPGVNGFIAHELQAQVSDAVTGTQDETEAIGTLADYDGTVLEAEVTEPPAEELEYTEEVETDGVATMVTRTRTWTPSGTRPVYQGVDQTKLIPLLTKALQEALDRIEQLESNTLQPLYATEADLPSATDHHGKTAHVHATGSLYFAHAGNWVKLQNA